MQQVVFRLLGPPEIRYKEQLIKVPRRRSRALLYYLVCTQAPQPRERLLALLCGDVDEESARHTFKTLLAEVRALLRSLDPAIEWIISDDDQLRFNPLAPLWLDTEIFEKGTAVTSRNLNRTLGLYRGDFLDGFFLRDAPGFETWVRGTRDHFRHLYLSTLRRLAELYEADNQLDQAITCVQMMLATDSLMEDAYASLMRLYWMTGKRIEALREYELLCEVLAQEFAVKPSASTQSLYEQIARNSRASAVASAPESPALTPEARERSYILSGGTEKAASVSERSWFVGRAAELAWLQKHLTKEISADPLILLAGEAGIGKTHLLRHLSGKLESAWKLLRGTCREVEQAHPYHAIVEALRQGLTTEDMAHLNLPGVWRTQLALLLPDLFPAVALTLDSASIQPLVIAEALETMFHQLASSPRPLLLLLDDLHWADESTLALLGHLTCSVQRGRVFLVGTFCPAFEAGRLGPLRRSAARQNRLAELCLSPLSSADIACLVSHFFANEKALPGSIAHHSALIDWCYQRSEGNPFFALAWLESARTSGETTSPFPLLAVPEPTVELVKAQFDCLSHEALSVLVAGAFLSSFPQAPGTSFDLCLAAELANIEKKNYLPASLELVQKGLVVETSPDRGEFYSFVHSSVRDVLLTVARPMQRHFCQQLEQSL